MYPDPANESAARDRCGPRGRGALLLTVLSHLGSVPESTFISNERRREAAPTIDPKDLLMELAGFLNNSREVIECIRVNFPPPRMFSPSLALHETSSLETMKRGRGQVRVTGGKNRIGMC